MLFNVAFPSLFLFRKLTHQYYSCNNGAKYKMEQLGKLQQETIVCEGGLQTGYHLGEFHGTRD